MSDRSDERLPSHVWILAGVKQSNAEGRPAMVARRGEAMGGTLLLKLNLLGAGCRVLTQMRDLDGRMGWLPAFKNEAVPDAAAEDYIARAVKRDPDLWVVEVEDREGRHPFGGKLLA